MRFLAQFSVVLLDLNGTFMFGHDRFGSDEDYYATYRALGGVRLGRAQLMATMTNCCAGLMRDYETAAKFDDFPTLAEAFRTHGEAADEDLELLEHVFATHELGQVPASYVACLRRISATHQLGLVSNICSRPGPWIEHLTAVDVAGLFTCTIFSSDGRSIKPSPALFQRALAAFPTDARVLFVGDNLERDIRPAQALGMATAWISPSGQPDSRADVTIASLLDLEHVAA